MAAHKETPLILCYDGSVLLGSVSAGVVRHADQPTLVIHRASNDAARAA
jgi:nucleotide-binding universal stress UspA family protein